MGFIFSKILDFFSRSRKNFKLIILGIQNAGKTSILYRLSLGQLVQTTPTIGSNVEEISYNNIKLQAWDLGGQESTRSVWDVYFVNTDAIIYVIDSNDKNYEESKNQFFKILENETLRNAVILIYANKQDLPDAKKADEIIELYELKKIKEHIWNIQPCSAQTGEGIITGMKWLSDQLIFRANNNFPVNPYVNFTSDKNDNIIDNKKQAKNKNKNNVIQGSLNNSEANLKNSNNQNNNTVGNINNNTNGE